MTRSVKYTDRAWLLLKRLAALQAEVVQCSDPYCLRFHMVIDGVLGEIVRNSMVDRLMAVGLLTRSHKPNPTYSVSAKGRRELQRENCQRAFVDSAASRNTEPREAGESLSF